MPMKEAISVCKTMLRNGFDAYVINMNLQLELLEKTRLKEIDIACEPNYETLAKLFPNLEHGNEQEVVGLLRSEDTGYTYRFYPTDLHEGSHPDVVSTRLTQNMLTRLANTAKEKYAAVRRLPEFLLSDDIIDDMACGSVCLAGIPALTLRRNYTWGIRVLRLAANYDLPVEPNTWVAIVQATREIAAYVPGKEFVAEWRQVSAESMWRFVQLLADSTLLHFLIPEVAALTTVKQNQGKAVDDEEIIFTHTVNCMRRYPEENLHHDWIGVVAVFFHEIGKLCTAEHVGKRWTFYQHHRVGAKIARRILANLGFEPTEIDTICGLINNQLRFQSMLTDRGIRRFRSLPDTDRLIEIARASLKAQKDGSYTNFNHNLKYLTRSDTPEQMLEPLLNGNQIMEYTGLHQGPEIGQLRDALLQAQIAGEIESEESAIAFVKSYLPKIK